MKDKVGYMTFCLGFVAFSILAFLISFMTPMSSDSPLVWHSEEILEGVRVFIFVIQEVAYLLIMLNLSVSTKRKEEK